MSQHDIQTQREEITLRDQQAASYDDWILQTKGAYFDLVDRTMPLRWLRLERSHAVLDAGCGTGRLTLPIARRCREVWAADFSPKSLEVLEQKTKAQGLTNVKTVLANLAEATLPSSHFDRAVSNSVIHHIPEANARLEAVRRIWESLKAGGVFVVMVFRWGGAITYQKEYWTKTESGNLFRMGFTAQELQALLQQAGFRNVQVGGLFNFRPRGLSRLPSLLRLYACVDVLLTESPFSQTRGKHLLARGIK
jgi:ubiquinone/menaquinone biosynthesis C-methylase UbiE